jgi:hypothetical protein
LHPIAEGRYTPSPPPSRITFTSHPLPTPELDVPEEYLIPDPIPSTAPQDDENERPSMELKRKWDLAELQLQLLEDASDDNLV